jgi:hypothetical protein
MTIEKTSTLVRVELGFTKNLGNFQNMKVSIAVEDFVRDGETVDSATERVYKFIEDKIEQKMREAEEENNGGK